MGKKIAVIDFETDPFLFGRLPRPFAWGFFDGEIYTSFWQADAWNNNKCAEQLCKFLEEYPEPLLILAHNGGKFDFLFFIEKLGGSIKIVNGRILEAKLGKHTLRDSYAILPVPLAKAGGKKEIEYSKMERDCRDDHKEEIMEYLRYDCLSLFDLCQAFYAEFGDVLTIGGAAMRELKKFHKFEAANESFDKLFRNYYFGGRCQCFETGVIKTAVKGYDLNSSYPDTMKNRLHPVSVGHTLTRNVNKKSSFVCWRGENYNAVPVRTKTGLDFTQETGIFWSTVHEFNAAENAGMIRPARIVHAVEFEQTATFEDFIDHFYTARLAAKADKDIFHEIFYKLILNSSYGKFAQSPDNFQDSIILPYGDVAPEPYMIEFTSGNYSIWSKPSMVKTYFNVATAASITGGARATLLTGLANAVRPLYCDTDSIYCEAINADLHQSNLGAWKHEFTGDSIAIAGKKLYAVMGGDKCLKTASKGVRLNHEQIYRIARGDVIEARNDAPTFKLDGKHIFISREVKRTGIKKAALC